MDLITSLGLVSAAFVALFTWRQFYGHDDGRGAQSRRESIIEAWTNIVIGFSINYAANLLFLPLVGARASGGDLFWLGWLYTAVSILRQYAIRRWFNAHGFAAAVARVIAWRPRA
jgi:hypothetical protein